MSTDAAVDSGNEWAHVIAAILGSRGMTVTAAEIETVVGYLTAISDAVMLLPPVPAAEDPLQRFDPGCPETAA